MVGNSEHLLTYAIFRASANATKETIAARWAAHGARPKSHYEWVQAGGEHLRLTTVIQNGSTTGCHLDRGPEPATQTFEPLSYFDNYDAAQAGVKEWVNYLNSGGTIEEWRQNNEAQAWIAWHQHWLQQIREHTVELYGWLRDHPDQEQYCDEQRKRALSDWLGAATLKATENPELYEYAVTCGITAGTLI